MENTNLLGMINKLDKKHKLRLPVKILPNELEVIRNEMVHGNKIDDHKVVKGLVEPVKIIEISLKKL